MAFRLPAPPPDSCFRTGADEQSRPLLRWRPPAGPGRWPSALFLGLWLCFMLCWGLGVFEGAVLNGGFKAWSWSDRVKISCTLVGCFVAVGVVGRRLLGLFRTPEPERLTFEPDLLSYVASGPVFAPDKPPPRGSSQAAEERVDSWRLGAERSALAQGPEKTALAWPTPGPAELPPS